ncbi:hypothetical protein AL035_05795 [Salipiger aestuarii]|uniref:Uncharacterized protein n=1 Tax=Salipiger aestuarii TaxID=568098 RepID=A0A327YEI5_9RHOB|nr:hypothetical protein AL035_05795 [Salipiger aestuarii]RAK19264.1 hypothetical protein ATI53_100937 [Salipiger aestuarii]
MSAFKQIGRKVLMGMQYADDLTPLSVRSVDYQMHSAGVDAYWGCELAPLPSHLWKVSEQIEEREQTIGIAIRLRNATVASSMTPDIG